MLPLAGSVISDYSGEAQAADWRTARRDSSGLAPDAASTAEAVITYLAREVPELRLELPSTAIGKDFLPTGAAFGSAPSGSGVQVSLLGVLGFTVAAEEGLEFNVLGLSLGVDAWPPALKLPGIGRIGMPKHAPDSEYWGVRRLVP